MAATDKRVADNHQMRITQWRENGAVVANAKHDVVAPGTLGRSQLPDQRELVRAGGHDQRRYSPLRAARASWSSTPLT